MKTFENRLKKEINVLIDASDSDQKITICQNLCNYEFGEDKKSEIYKNIFNDFEIIYFLNKSMCNYYHAVIYFCNDESKLNLVKEEVNSIYKTISTKIIIGPFSCKKRENFIFINSTISKSDEISQILINSYLCDFENIKQIFLNFDEDKSGYIESCEVNLVAKALGQDTKSDIFKKSILALDSNNDDKISLEEFVEWWMRKDEADVLSKIKDMTKIFDESVYEFLLFNNIKKESKKKSRQKIKSLDININNSKENSLEVSRLSLRVSLGEFESNDASKNYLSKFNDDLSNSKRNWIAFAFFIRPNTLSKEEFKSLIDNFSINFITFLDKLLLDHPTQNFFTKNFSKIFYWEIQMYELSANLILHFKYDIICLIKSNLENIMLLINFLCGNYNVFKRRSSGVNFELDLSSTENIFNKSSNKIDFSNILDIECRGHYDFNKLQILLKNLNKKTKGSTDFSCLTKDLDSNEEYLNFIKDLKLEKVIQCFTGLKSIIDTQLSASTSRMEFSLNLFDIFLNMGFKI